MPGMTINSQEIIIQISSGAPRGSGVKDMTSEFAGMRVTSSSGRSSSRSVPYSTMSETQPQATDKRGELTIVIFQYSIFLLFSRYCW
jgi:hypothetical protein